MIFRLLLDLWAWTRDMNYLTSLVQKMTVAEELDKEQLIRATVQLKALSDAPVDGYRRTRFARHAMWKMEGIDG